MITAFVLSVKFYRLSVKELALEKAPPSVLSHTHEQLGAIHASKTTIVIVGVFILLLTLPFLRFITYDAKGLAVVCYAKAAQSNVLALSLMDELGRMMLVDGEVTVARDVRGVQSDCEEPTKQEVAATIFKKGLTLSDAQQWTRQTLESSGYVKAENQQFYPYGTETNLFRDTYPISHVTDTFVSIDRRLRIEYVFEVDVQCDKLFCEETDPLLADAPLEYVFATMTMKS